jgi:signal transduction histidine kinase
LVWLRQKDADLVNEVARIEGLLDISDNESRYRIRAAIEPQLPNSILILAAPLNDVDTTLHRLFLIELLVTLAALGALVGLGLWVVRLGLRPLAEIGRTADAIAGGDLSQRVRRAEPRTEIGRLGLTFNAMLDRIEASDRRLRRFVADASHELRTPLAAVRAYAELFERGAAQRPDDLARAMRGIGRLSRISSCSLGSTRAVSSLATRSGWTRSQRRPLRRRAPSTRRTRSTSSSRRRPSSATAARCAR